MRGLGKSRGVTILQPRRLCIAELLGEPVSVGSQDEVRLTGKLFAWGYHGWPYGLDTEPISVPEFENSDEFDREHFALTPAREESRLP